MRTTQFSGTIIAVPLAVHDHRTHETIKESELYLHTDFADSKCRITGLIPEGCFQAEVQNLDAIRQLAPQDEPDWADSVERLLNGVYSGKLMLRAKFVSSRSYYVDGKLRDDDDLELIEEFVTLSVTEHGTLAKVYGSVQLSLQEDDTAEQDMFNWMSLLTQQAATATAQQAAQQQHIDAVTAENVALRRTLDETTTLQRKIVSDLENKFYQLLESKKQRIMQLEHLQTSQLEALNEEYLHKNKLNLSKAVINRDEIPDKLQDVYIKKAPRKRATRANRKRSLVESAQSEDSDHEPKKNAKLVRQSAPKATQGSDTAAAARRTMSKLSDKQLASEILGSDSASAASGDEQTEVSNTDSDADTEQEAAESKSGNVKLVPNQASKQESQPEISNVKSAGDLLDRDMENADSRSDRSVVSNAFNETDYSSGD